MDSKYIINLQGRNFVKFEGLLAEFHLNGGKSIETIECPNSTAEEPKFKAVVKGEKGEFTGHGDASDMNVNSMIKRHKYRMAETRAIARALRWYNNIGECSIDELGGEETPVDEYKTPRPQGNANINPVIADTVNKLKNYQKPNNDDKPWITDELFEDAVKKSVEAGVFKVGMDINEPMKILRMKYKVAKKYEALISNTIAKYAMGING